MSATLRRRLLMVAYVFPPFFSVGGSIRVVKFARYLTELGWLPSVLTIDDSKEYENQRRQGSESLLAELPSEVVVHRTTSGEPSAEMMARGRQARERNPLAALVINILSAVRRFAGRHLLIPDENITWLPFALRKGGQVLKDEKSDGIWATCPPHSAAVVGLALRMAARKPLILDYRDDWIDTPWHQAKPWLRRQFERLLERWCVRSASRVVLVTPQSRDAFVARYPRQPVDKFVCIPNGCDLSDYAEPERTDTLAPGERSSFTIMHAGLLSVAEDWKRSPQPFFTALAALSTGDAGNGHIPGLQATFTGQLPEAYRDLVGAMGLGDRVRELGYLPLDEYHTAMARADLLLAINYDGWSTIIPGKIYDYWAVGGPPILLLSCHGAAEWLVNKHNLGSTVDPTDAEAIAKAIWTFYRAHQQGTPVRISRQGIETYDRRALAVRLAHVLDMVCTQKG
jgi:glycosyltransferase involved in cell wall biosynthesis